MPTETNGTKGTNTSTATNASTAKTMTHVRVNILVTNVKKIVAVNRIAMKGMIQKSAILKIAESAILV